MARHSIKPYARSLDLDFSSFLLDGRLQDAPARLDGSGHSSPLNRRGNLPVERSEDGRLSR